MEMKNKTKFKETEIGKIPEDWEIVSFKDAVEINPYRNLNKDTTAKFVPMSALKPFVRKITYLEKRIYKGGNKFKNNDTLLAKITPCLENGKTAFVNVLEKEEVAFGSSEFIVLSSKPDKTDPKFLYYLAIEPNFRKVTIKSMTGTSGRQRVQNSILENILVALPSISEQTKIVKILSSLDDKIELNNKINNSLEQISQTIFKHWFINFEFPNEQGQPYKSSGGEFVDLELGKIPKEWRIGFLNNFNIEVGSGKWGLEKHTDKNSLEVNCIRGTDLAEINVGRLVNLPKRFISASDGKNSFLRHGDIVIEISGGSPTQSTGRVLFISKEIINFYNNKLICSNFCKVIRTSNIFESYYLYNLLKLLYEKGIFFNFENGTTGIKNLDFKFLFSRYKIIIPGKKVVEYFFYKTHNLISKIYNNAIQNDKLSQIRDTLLPKLITGKIRVNLEDIKES
jgi:type I restriction enzyme S subunit